MNISGKGLDLIKQFEGCVLRPYKDLGGRWTIGWGHLITGADIAAGRYRTAITQSEADALLEADVSGAIAAVGHYVTAALNQNQFDALVSWTFNVGIGALAQSTLLRVLNRGDYELVPDQIRRWVYAGGQPNAVLARRRAKEAALFEEPVAA